MNDKLVKLLADLHRAFQARNHGWIRHCLHELEVSGMEGEACYSEEIQLIAKAKRFVKGLSQ